MQDAHLLPLLTFQRHEGWIKVWESRRYRAGSLRATMWCYHSSIAPSKQQSFFYRFSGGNTWFLLNWKCLTLPLMAAISPAASARVIVTGLFLVFETVELFSLATNTRYPRIRDIDKRASSRSYAAATSISVSIPELSEATVLNTDSVGPPKFQRPDR